MAAALHFDARKNTTAGRHQAAIWIAVAMGTEAYVNDRNFRGEELKFAAKEF